MKKITKEQKDTIIGWVFIGAVVALSSGYAYNYSKAKNKGDFYNVIIGKDDLVDLMSKKD